MPAFDLAAREEQDVRTDVLAELWKAGTERRVKLHGGYLASDRLEGFGYHNGEWLTVLQGKVPTLGELVVGECPDGRYLIGALHFQGGEVWLTDAAGEQLCRCGEPFVLLGRVAIRQMPRSRRQEAQAAA